MRTPAVVGAVRYLACRSGRGGVVGGRSVYKIVA